MRLSVRSGPKKTTRILTAKVLKAKNDAKDIPIRMRFLWRIFYHAYIGPWMNIQPFCSFNVQLTKENAMNAHQKWEALPQSHSYSMGVEIH